MKMNISKEWLAKKLAVAGDTEAAAGQSYNWRAAYEEEARKFQQETLRTSELTRMLLQFVEHHDKYHSPGPWARGCDLCRMVGEAKTLLTRSINLPANARLTGAEPVGGASELKR